MGKLVAFCLACAVAWGADDAWQKVKDLKAGSDIRILKNGAAKAVPGKFAGATDDQLMVVLKRDEVAIDKAAIDRIDFHPPRSKPVKSESSQTTTDGYGANTTWSSGASWSRDGWQTIYQKHSNK